MRLKRLDARVIHTRHDEIIVAVGDDLADRVRVIVKASKASKRIIREVLFVAEIGVAEA
jgi:hypothetical protein